MSWERAPLSVEAITSAAPHRVLDEILCGADGGEQLQQSEAEEHRGKPDAEDRDAVGDQPAHGQLLGGADAGRQHG